MLVIVLSATVIAPFALLGTGSSVAVPPVLLLGLGTVLLLVLFGSGTVLLVVLLGAGTLLLVLLLGSCTILLVVLVLLSSGQVMAARCPRQMETFSCFLSPIIWTCCCSS